MKYLVKITVHIDGYEKKVLNVVDAENKEDAEIKGLNAECHNDGATYDGNVMYDGIDFMYRVYGCVELTDDQYATLSELNIR